MNSLTMTPQAPASGRRQGRSRACRSNQARTGRCSSAGTAGTPGIPEASGTEGVSMEVMAPPILTRFRGDQRASYGACPPGPGFSWGAAGFSYEGAGCPYGEGAP